MEINALWYNALCHMHAWAERLGLPPRPRASYSASYAELAARARESFKARFWCPQGYLYDVVDTPDGVPDPRLRPNQLFAAALPHPILERGRTQTMLATVRRYLLTPVGMRTLAPEHPDYQGRYAGDQWHRDGAYHQGTVWPWLSVATWMPVAAWRLRGGASRLTRELVQHLGQAGVGSISEIFDGAPPHPAAVRPRPGASRAVAHPQRVNMPL